MGACPLMQGTLTWEHSPHKKAEMAVLANETAEEHCCYNQSKEDSVSLFIFNAPPPFFLTFQMHTK